MRSPHRNILTWKRSQELLAVRRQCEPLHHCAAHYIECKIVLWGEYPGFCLLMRIISVESFTHFPYNFFPLFRVTGDQSPLLLLLQWPNISMWMRNILTERIMWEKVGYAWLIMLLMLVQIFHLLPTPWYQHFIWCTKILQWPFSFAKGW